MHDLLIENVYRNVIFLILFSSELHQHGTAVKKQYQFKVARMAANYSK